MQGEGPYVGCRQVFIRFEGCNLSCRYCDTRPGSEAKVCRIEAGSGEGSCIELVNPVYSKDIIKIVKERFLSCCRHHSVSITGGEPLLQADFLKELLPGLRQPGTEIYLETNGSLPEKLGQVIHLVDIISMDIKLPGTSGCLPLWDIHAQFLSIARSVKVFVKIVVDDESSEGEFERALDLIAGADKKVPLVIQPATYGGRCGLSPERALDLQALGLKRLDDVRVIPQAHVMMGQR